MKGAALVAVAATIGNFLQGWDNATIAGAIVYIKAELKLPPAVEGVIMAMSLIGATLITTCSGAISDTLGRRPMLIFSASMYFVSSLVMSWSPNVYVLLLARLIDGFGIGVAVTLVPIYISETSPPDIRGLLNTLPQFSGSGGMFLSYCLIFGMSFMPSLRWRLMLGVLGIPSVFYLLCAFFYLPESPRWLVSKGKMSEAKKALKRLRGIEDVSGDMALLVEGLGVGGETSVREYIVGPGDEHKEDQDSGSDREKIKLYGAEEGLSWIAKPLTSKISRPGLASQHGSVVNQSLVDPIVNLFGGVQEKQPEQGSMRSALFPNYGSMYSATDAHSQRGRHLDEETEHTDGDDYQAEPGGKASESDNLEASLISRQATTAGKDTATPTSQDTVLSMGGQESLLQASGETVGSMVIGGGWQLAWTLDEKEGSEDGKKTGDGFQRMYLHQDRGAVILPPAGGEGQEEGDHVQAFVSKPAMYKRQLMDQHPVGPAMVHPSETVTQGPNWKALLDPGVKRALFVGIGIQLLQQFSGINGILYFTPQILEEAGVEVLLADVGITGKSASFLISALTTFLMLPCIGVAMKLMDISGRRSLLLATIPVLIVSLIILVIACTVNLSHVVNAVISTACVIVYFCTFVMAYGPIPNILCSEIFPTRVRGVCIAICSLVFWIGNIIITYTSPVLLRCIGLGGIFAIYAAVCIISWVFVYLKIPETKGMPLEVITEFFAVGS